LGRASNPQRIEEWVLRSSGVFTSGGKNSPTKGTWQKNHVLKRRKRKTKGRIFGESLGKGMQLKKEGSSKEGRHKIFIKKTVGGRGT